MSTIVDAAHELVDEVGTESSGMAAAIGVAAVGAVVLGVSALAGRAAGSTVPGARVGWAAVRALTVAVWFAVVAVQVVGSGWITGADADTLQWFVAHRNGTATAFALVITSIGGVAGATTLAVLVSLVLGWRRRSVVPTVFVLGVVSFAAGAGTLTKHVLGRERPPAVLQLTSETNFAFPSGHATATAALVGAVLVLYLPARPGRAKAVAATVGGVAVVAAVATTRLYLGVHWLTDVIGGALLGTTVTLVGAALLVWWSPTTGRAPVGDAD